MISGRLAIRKDKGGQRKRHQSSPLPQATPINRPDINADDNLIRRGTSANAPVSSEDRRELHDLKLKTSLFNLIPLLAPLKFLWDAAFFNPSKAAASRPDFLAGARSYSSAVVQERRKKNDQLKASLIPALAGLSLFILPTSIKGRCIFSPQRFVPAILVALGYGYLKSLMHPILINNCSLVEKSSQYFSPRVF